MQLNIFEKLFIETAIKNSIKPDTIEYDELLNQRGCIDKEKMHLYLTKYYDEKVSNSVHNFKYKKMNTIVPTIALVASLPLVENNYLQTKRIKI